MRFIDRTNDRKLPADWSGRVLIWDIDKTYLDTRFSSLRGLLSIPFEFAMDKRDLPGTVPLLHALRHGAGDVSALVPLYFVSGSPPVLRKVIERKMTLDGVQFDGITFKDQWALLKARRPRAIVRQLGYKLTALLLYRRELPSGARFVLFGDDVEQDLTCFLLFGEVCAGLRGGPLRERMRVLGAFGDEIDAAVDVAAQLPVEPDPVERIFIHELKGGTRSNDARVVLSPSFLTHAVALVALGAMRIDALRAVAADVRKKKVPDAQVRQLLADASDRFGVAIPANV